MFEVVSSVALSGCFKVVLRVVMSVVLRLFERCLRLYRVLL